MDINLVYTRIVEKLKESNKISIIEELKECSLAGTTGGEVLGIMAYYLKHLKEKNPSAYELVQKEIEEILNYCEKTGLYIR